MDFSSWVLMEKDKETWYITKELWSCEVNEGALFVRKLFVLDDEVNLYFDTNKDVEEWEYSAIYDLFNEDRFVEEGFSIEDDLDEYNPTFILKFKYEEEYNDMKELITKAVNLIQEEMNSIIEKIEGKEEDYK